MFKVYERLKAKPCNHKRVDVTEQLSHVPQSPVLILASAFLLLVNSISLI